PPRLRAKVDHSRLGVGVDHIERRVQGVLSTVGQCVGDRLYGLEGRLRQIDSPPGGPPLQTEAESPGSVRPALEVLAVLPGGYDGPPDPGIFLIPVYPEVDLGFL